MQDRIEVAARKLTSTIYAGGNRKIFGASETTRMAAHRVVWRFVSEPLSQ